MRSNIFDQYETTFRGEDLFFDIERKPKYILLICILFFIIYYYFYLWYNYFKIFSSYFTLPGHIPNMISTVYSLYNAFLEFDLASTSSIMIFHIPFYRILPTIKIGHPMV